MEATGIILCIARDLKLCILLQMLMYCEVQGVDKIMETLATLNVFLAFVYTV
jgi:hypothetical protein